MLKQSPPGQACLEQKQFDVYCQMTMVGIGIVSLFIMPGEKIKFILSVFFYLSREVGGHHLSPWPGGDQPHQSIVGPTTPQELTFFVLFLVV